MYDEVIEDNMTEQEKLLLDIIEAGNELTEQQMSAIIDNPTLADDYRVLISAKAAIKSKQKNIDVDKKLADFKAIHNNPRRHNSIVWWSAAAVVAAAVACLFIMLPTTKVAEPEHNVSGHVFTADIANHDVTLLIANETITSVKKSSSAPFTEIDANNVLADSEPDEKVTLQVPLGKSAHLTLPDGSEVWLYPDSRLKFPQRFASNKREVVLEGQAYFSVVKNTEQPFVVIANGMQTTVLGTEFVVSAYENTEPTVALVSGKVEVKKDMAKAVLTPGKQARLNANGHFTMNNVDTEHYVHWRDGYFYFDNATLHDILLAIGRNYNVCVICPNPESLNVRMRFIANRNEPLSNIVQRLNELGGIKVVVNGKKIEIK